MALPPAQERQLLPVLVAPLPVLVRLRLAAARKPALPPGQAPSRLQVRPASQHQPQAPTAAYLALLRSH